MLIRFPWCRHNKPYTLSIFGVKASVFWFVYGHKRVSELNYYKCATLGPADK